MGSMSRSGRFLASRIGEVCSGALDAPSPTSFEQQASVSCIRVKMGGAGMFTEGALFSSRPQLLLKTADVDARAAQYGMSCCTSSSSLAKDAGNFTMVGASPLLPVVLVLEISGEP